MKKYTPNNAKWQITILALLLVSFGFIGSASANDTLRLSLQASGGTTTIDAGDPAIDFVGADLPQGSFGFGGMLQLTGHVVDGFWLGPYFHYEYTKFEVADDSYELFTPAVGLVFRVDVFDPIVLQVAVGYSFGTATADIQGSSEDADMIGIQSQLWGGYQFDLVPDLLLMDVGVFLTYEGLNPKDDYFPDREYTKNALARTLTYKTFGFGVHFHWNLF